MKSWKKTSLLTTLIILVLLSSVYYIFNMSVSVPSSDIEFSPGQVEGKLNGVYEGQKPKNIIVFIADGMGFSHLSLALQTQQTENTPSVWQAFDVKGWHDPRSLIGPLTDSEASATAMATGVSTNFGHIGMSNEGETLENIFEMAWAMNYATGIVTDSYVWDGTPAAFTVHTRNEDDARDILTQLANSDLDLLFGELEDVGEDEVPEVEETIAILEKRFQLLDASLKLPTGDAATSPVAVLFEEDEIQDLDSEPNLPELTETALEYLTNQGKAFLLLVECEEMDSASHTNNTDRVVKGLQSLQKTLAMLQEFVEKNGETLLIFTSDHETGGLATLSDYNNYPNMQVRWSTNEHSAAVVPLFAKGPGAHCFADVHRNWQIGDCLIELISQNTPGL
ncbi:MAG: alkaline phosphatase [Bacteroidia bacterium]|nr:alkaline phosphatase [Bacteroidia bacterium]NNM09210.1 alkaline phosphatase [Flavobacteriaceae bacterium]